ncbi:MAG: Alpha-L-arabinofuranosidase C-terminal domain, partial [Chloroflexi bacterium]|nr:Alpha-L-arabinofuranosidase C-terminal domain [Chloroflexota bacterium]
RGERLTLAVVNRHREEALAADIEVAGAEVAPGGRWYELADADADVRAGNSAATPGRVGPREGKLTSGARFNYRFPPHSLTLLTLRCSTTKEPRH